MRCIPHRHQLSAGLADVLGIDNRAAERIFRIQPIQQTRIDLDVDLKAAIQPNAGRVDRHPGMHGTAFEQQTPAALH